MKSQNIKYLAAFIIMLLLAFLQCYRAVRGLHWAFEPDFDRDIGYIRNTLNGHYGSDPNYIGEYMWYNPLLYLSEAAIVKITGLPINIVVARAGAFLNLLAPIFFFIMVRKLFDYKIALAALLSFLFLASGNIPGWGGATYSPLPLANSYVQFIFYFNIFLCYKAFSTQKIRWFTILGIFLGIGFLGHAAPTIIIILMLILLQGQKHIAAIKTKEYSSIKTYLLQGLFTLVPFLVFSFPFLYFVLIKYHLHFVNRIILQCAPRIFARANSIELLKLNLTFPFVIAAIGFVMFCRKYNNPLIKKIILYWLYITVFMYLYEAILPTANRMLHITLPDTIPALHYFFYLKGVQSVFFAFGFVYLVDLAIHWMEGYAAKRRLRKIPVLLSSNLFVIFVLLYVIIYYPIYSNRADFVVPRQQALAKEKETDKIEVYDFIVKNIPLNRVMLCKHDQSLFPVMAAGIKMVSVEIYFSNPYVSYEQRENDRNEMLSYLVASAPSPAEKLFLKYKVSYVLLPNNDFEQYKTPAFLTSNVIFTNKSFTIMSLTMAGNK